MKNMMKRALCLLLIVMTVTLLGTVVASAADGSAVVATVNGVGYASLTEAIAAAEAGDTVTVSEGTYDGFMVYKSDITVVADGNVTINGMIFVAGNRVVLDGLNVNNIYGGAALEISGKTTVKNCALTGDLAVRANSGNAAVVLENVEVNGRMDLAHSHASIKAVEGLNVTASVGTGEVDYVNGVYHLKGHIEEIIPGVSPTVNSTGLTEGVKCALCGEILVAQQVIDRLTPVAQVNDDFYGTLADAIAAAKDGDTVKLLLDITLTPEDTTLLGTSHVAVLVSGKSITLDLNGCHLKADFADATEGYVGVAVDKGAELIFKDSGNGGLTVVGDYAYYAFRNSGKLTIESGTVTFTGFAGGATFFSTNSDLLVKGGNFTQTTKGWMVNTSGNGAVAITFVGGTYNRYFVGGSKYGENPYNEFKLGEGLTLNDNGDGTWTIGEVDFTPVAQVGDRVFGSLKKAIEAAQNGETVILLDNVNITALDTNVVKDGTYGYSTLFAIEGKSITLDFNGYTLTVTPETSSMLITVFFLGQDASLTVKDSVGNGGLHVNAGSDLYCAFYNSESTLVIENGDYYVEKVVISGALVYADKKNDITVENGNFTLGNAGVDASSTKPWIFNVHGKNEGNFVQVKGGYFNQNLLMNKDTQKDCEVALPDGYKLQEVGNGIWTVVYTPVAQVGDRIYGTVADALAAAQNGETVILLDNVNITALDTNVVKDSTYGYSVLFAIEGKSITLDFNGYTLTVTPETSSMLITVFFLGQDASLTVKDSVGNGGLHVNAGSDLYCAFYNSESTLVIENGDYYVEKVVISGALVYADKKNDITVENGNFTLGNAGVDASSTKPWIFNVHGKNEGNFVQVKGGYFNQNLLMNKDTQKDCEVALPDGYKLQEVGNGIWTVVYTPIAQVSDKTFGIPEDVQADEAE